MVKFTNNCTTLNSQLISYTSTSPYNHNCTLVKSTNNCATWWNSSQQHPNNTQLKLYLNNTLPQCHNCKSWWNSQPITLHGEIHKNSTIILETNNVKDFYRNCKNFCSCYIYIFNNWKLTFAATLAEAGQNVTGTAGAWISLN